MHFYYWRCNFNWLLLIDEHCCCKKQFNELKPIGNCCCKKLQICMAPILNGGMIFDQCSLLYQTIEIYHCRPYLYRNRLRRLRHTRLEDQTRCRNYMSHNNNIAAWLPSNSRQYYVETKRLMWSRIREWLYLYITIKYRKNVILLLWWSDCC